MRYDIYLFFKTSDGLGWLGGGDFFIIFILFIYSNLLLPPKIIRMFGPKMVIFAPKYALLGTFNPCWLHWLVGGCSAWAALTIERIPTS